MESFHMTDIINLLGLPYPQHGQSSYYIQCPCCDDSPRGRHLNINLQKDVFRCPRCGVSGGIFDLYALFTNTPRDRVYQSITERLGPPVDFKRQKVHIVPQQSIKEYPITDVESRHATYSALLKKLSLAKDHRENLLNRGLTDRDIEENEYKTTPVLGMATLAKQLQSEGLYLQGVPGFYRSENGQWTFIHEQRGILIPVRNLLGQIQGLQIRRDNVMKRKFRWVSSTNLKDGCKAEGWTHLAGPVTDTIILTEGPMKADVIHTLTGLTVLAVPGVNSLSQLKATLIALREKGLREVKTAFDMDFSINAHVQNGYQNLLCLLDELGFRFGVYLWDPRYKGLDDYVYSTLTQQKL